MISISKLTKRLAAVCASAVIGLCSGGGLCAQTVEVFAGADLHYRNIYHNNRVFDVLLNITPAFKWHTEHDWLVAAQLYVPVVNDYGDYYKKVRLNMAVLSKEMKLGSQCLKLSGGLFGEERYGLDAKWMWPITEWLALDAQLGYTGFFSMASTWRYSPMDRFTGYVGGRLYHRQSDSELRGRIGRFIYADYGIEGEWYKHFKFCSVGVYAQYSKQFHVNGGFKIILSFPKKWRAGRTVILRPASNFRVTYNNKARPYSMKMYTTDPEENERDGFFEKSDWGLNRNR